MPYKYVRIAGNRRQVGVALGRLARPLMATYLDQSATWKALRPWRGHPYVTELGEQARAALPAIWEELEGLAEGLGMPLADVLLWNCRGDLLHSSGSGDGCTSVALKAADGTRWIGHNEDGDPFLYGRCHLVDVALDDAPGYLSFYYPGSLPGHTFGANRAGLVQTINNLRTRLRQRGLPRMLLARAVLDCATLDEAVALLRDAPRAGAFTIRWGRRPTPASSASRRRRAPLQRRRSAPGMATPTTWCIRPAGGNRRSSPTRRASASAASRASSTPGPPPPLAPTC